MMFPHTVTLYNQHGQRWHRTVLKGVFWDSSVGATLRKSGVAPADGMQLIIPRSVPGYMKPRAWDALTDKTGVWTLKSGDKAVFGEQGEVQGTKGFDLLDDVITLTLTDDHNFGAGMANLEVTGK